MNRFTGLPSPLFFPSAIIFQLPFLFSTKNRFLCASPDVTRRGGIPPGSPRLVTSTASRSNPTRPQRRHPQKQVSCLQSAGGGTAVSVAAAVVDGASSCVSYSPSSPSHALQLLYLVYLLLWPDLRTPPLPRRPRQTTLHFILPLHHPLRSFLSFLLALTPRGALHLHLSDTPRSGQHP